MSKPKDSFDPWPAIMTIAESVQQGKATAQANITEALSRVKQVQDEYNVIISLVEERALQRAQEVDRLVKEGAKVGKLAGVPFIAKDNYLTFGGETTAASNVLKGFKASYQSTVIELLEQEGAICVAKANMDAFAHGGSTENSDFGVTKNPHDTNRVPGGSSGGSAAAIALNLVPFALGSDTGGSIRQPASFCGIVGYKPTYGLVSRSGVVAMASSTDCMGPMTNSVEDAAVVLEVMAGKDDLDSTTIERDEKPYTQLDAPLKGKRIGVIKEWFDKGLNAAVSEEIKRGIAKLKEQGAEIVDVSLPSLPAALAVYYIVVPAELSSNLSRHDGQRYQFSAEDASSLEESYKKTRSQGFGAEAKRRIMIGTHVLSSGYYDAYYKKAQTVRTKIINEFVDAFKDVDLLVGPVSPTTAFKIGENEDPMQMYLQDMYSVGPSLAGLPAISVPCGEVDSLPVGLQLVGPQRSDRTLLSIAREFEEAMA